MLKEAKRPVPDHPEPNLDPGVRAGHTTSPSLCILGSGLGKFSDVLGLLAPESIPVGMATVGELGLLGDDIAKGKRKRKRKLRLWPPREKVAEGPPTPW